MTTEEALEAYKNSAASAEPSDPAEQAQSLQWLRDHGIEVETPEDRKRAAELAKAAAGLSASDPGTRTFRYVYIPADASVPVSERTAVVYDDARGRGDQLTVLLKPHFSSGSVDADALRRVVESTHLGNDASKLGQVTPESIAASGGGVETFRLADGVSLYLDAVSALKSLPLNERAAALASQCGYGSVPLYGDMFVGRTDKETGNNADFTTDDMRPETAEWLRGAAEQNLARQAAESGSRAGGVASEDLYNVQNGTGDGYTWSQTEEDVEVQVPLPTGAKAKACKVAFGRRKLQIDISGGISLNFDPLYGTVAPDDCTWSVSDGSLVITMEKAKQMEVWPTLA